MIRTKCIKLLVFCFLAVFIAGCDYDIPPSNESNYFLTIEDEIQLGRVIWQTLSQDPAYSFIDTTGSPEYVEMYDYLYSLQDLILNTTMVVYGNANLDNIRLDWEVHIINDTSQEVAFMTPGGHFYISTGLLCKINKRHEYLGLISSQIILADRGFVRDKLQSFYGFYPLIDLLTELRSDTNVSAEPELIGVLSDPEFSYEELEIEKIDRLAVEALCPYNFKSDGLLDLLIRLDNTGLLIEYALLHPDLQNRISALQVFHDENPSCGGSSTDPNLDFKNKVKNVIGCI